MIKKSGVYEVEVKIFREVKGTIKLWVVAEGENLESLKKSVEANAE